MDLRPYFYKHVIVTDIDDIVYKGFISIGTIPGDSDEDCYEIDLEGTTQYPEGIFNLTEHEIKSIMLDPAYND